MTNGELLLDDLSRVDVINEPLREGRPRNVRRQRRAELQPVDRLRAHRRKYIVDLGTRGLDRSGGEA